MSLQITNNKDQTTKKVAVGLSGGVDSSVTAALLVEQGYEVTGVFLECWRAPGCRVDEDRKDALDIAMQLGIPYKVLDFKKEYKDRVVEYFYREYEAGRTPNPDTMCNREIKFGMFYDWAMAEGFDAMATGHYARVERQELRGKRPFDKLKVNKETTKSEKTKNVEVTGKELSILKQVQDDEMVLLRGIDPKKDQSYFLYQLRPDQLPHVLFPIGHLTKAEVRQEAEKRGLATASKPDSQGICFIGEVNVNGFLKERIEEKRGDVVIKLADSGWQIADGNKNSGLSAISYKPYAHALVGHHEGVPFYTIGQKVGKELDQALVAKLAKEGFLDFDPSNMPPLFVIDKDIKANTLIIGTEEETKADSFKVSELNLLVDQVTFDEAIKDCAVRIRHGGKLIRAGISQLCSEELEVDLAEPVKGIASGQACVIYSDTSAEAIVLAGGVIAER